MMKAEAPLPTLQPNIAAAVAYLFLFLSGAALLAIAPYSRSRLIRFHAWQAILLSAVIVALGIALRVLDWLLPWFVSLFLGMLCGFTIFVVWIALMVMALRGRRLALPVIGSAAQRLA